MQSIGKTDAGQRSTYVEWIYDMYVSTARHIADCITFDLRLQKILDDLRSQCDAQVYELEKRTNDLGKMKQLLQSATRTLYSTQQHVNEQKHLVRRYVKTEEVLRDQAENVLSVVNEATEDARKLHDNLDRET